MTPGLVAFWAFAAAGLAGAVGLVAAARTPFVAALCLLATLLSLAGVSVLLEAYLLAAAQLLVYAGGTVTLFAVAARLAPAALETRGTGRPPPSRLIVLRAAGSVLALLAAAQLAVVVLGASGPTPALPGGFGGVRSVGALLWTHHLLALEAVSLLLLVASVGVVVLARPGARREPEARP